MDRPILTPLLKQLRAKAVSKFVNGSVLDIGCGDSCILNILKGKITDYYGIDNKFYVPDSIIELTKRYDINYQFFKLDLENNELPQFNMKFDTILMIAVIEHLKNPENILVKISKYLKEDGQLIITTPTPLADIIHGLGSKLNIFSKEASEKHYRLYNRKSMEKLIEKIDFSIVQYKTFEFGLNQLFVINMEKNEQ